MEVRVSTVGSRHKGNAEGFHVTVFQRKKNTAKKQVDKKPDALTVPEFDVKKATKEIMKLGVKGFYKRRRDQTLKSLAVELGAKREKSRYHNYKELKQIRRTQKERREERLLLLKSSSNLSAVNHYRKKYARKIKRKKEVDIASNYGKIK